MLGMNQQAHASHAIAAMRVRASRRTRRRGALTATVAILSVLSSVLSAGFNEELLGCYNAEEPKPASFESFLAQQAPSMAIHQLWRSAAPPSLQLTILTAATLSRLDALAAQCDSWAGPLSAAVYVTLPPPALFDSADARAHSGGCQLTMALLVEVVTDDTVSQLLPINALRNAALAASSTPLVALIDVDLLPSSGLAKELGDPESFREMRDGCASKQAWILPAFETPKQMALAEGVELVKSAVAGPKAALGPLIAAGKLQPFASVAYPRGHVCTDFQRWYALDAGGAGGAMPGAGEGPPAGEVGAAAGGGARPYGVGLGVNCEPWFVIDRAACPPYDARFRGYGWNKVQHVALVNASGFSFVVHPSAFIVHRPHPKSEAQGLYTDAAKGGSGESPGKLFHRKVAAMRHVALRDMKRGTYVAVTDSESALCRRQLSWWAQEGS
ncbi:hypothetical protein FOA52_001755 [Chlamydomonas sp. UWO 241]|nr:hypothetical protein FOA52_001755 [Chlamydomonas sp. UWO 241]